MDDLYSIGTGVAIVVTALGYQFFVGRKKPIGWVFGVASYLVWVVDMWRTSQWAYVSVGLFLTGLCLYNWRAWRQAKEKPGDD